MVSMVIMKIVDGEKKADFVFANKNQKIVMNMLSWLVSREDYINGNVSYFTKNGMK